MTTDDKKIDNFKKVIAKTATEVVERKHYWAYSHGPKRSAYVHYNGRIVRIKKSSPEIAQIGFEILGEPNGMASVVSGQDKLVYTWFLNGKTHFTGAPR